MSSDVHPLPAAPAVTVLMAVHNGLPYLAEALDSVLSQTFSDFEFLIIDDGSSDGSSELLHRYARRDPRIRVIKNPHRGFVASLNQGLDLATAPLVARFDADDVCLPHRLALQVEYLRQHPECVLVGGFVELIDHKGRAIRTLRPPIDHDAIDARHLAGHTSIPHPVALFRLDAVRKVGRYDPRFSAGQDLDLWLRLAEVGTLHNLPLPLIKYRQHRHSISSTRADSQLAAMRESCRLAWQRRRISGTFEPTTHWRPGPDRSSRLRYSLSEGWCAFVSGNRHTAFVYGSYALRIQPLSLGAWKLLACASFKKVPRLPAP